MDFFKTITVSAFKQKFLVTTSADGVWIYLVFGLRWNNNVELIALTTTQDIAEKYKMISEGKIRVYDAKGLNSDPRHMFTKVWIEERLTNHLLGDLMYPKSTI